MVRTHFPVTPTAAALHDTPASEQHFELLPWADPYIAMLVNRYLAESQPPKPRRSIRSVQVMTSAPGDESMLDRFAI